TPRADVIFQVASGILQPSRFFGKSLSGEANSGLTFSEARHDIPPSRLMKTPRSVSANIWNVRSFDAARRWTLAPTRPQLTSVQDFIPSRVKNACPLASLNQATCGSSHENWIEVTAGFNHPSTAYGFPFHAYSLSNGRWSMGTGFTACLA